MSLILDQFARMISDGLPDRSGLWADISESGYLDVLVSEEQGGAGLELGDAFPFAFLLGRRGVDLPVVETMVARVIAGGDAPTGMIVLSDRRPWREDVADRASVLVSNAGKSSLAEGEVGCPASAAQLRATAAALMAARMAGAMQAISDLTIDYALTRRQFGREIARFQAVQQQIAVMAEEAAAASAAARSALAASLAFVPELPAAVAKARACQAADIVAATGHAVHGAIGVSMEYALGRHVGQLRAWGAAYGGRSYWEGRLGAAVVQGKDGFLDSVRFETANA